MSPHPTFSFICLFININVLSCLSIYFDLLDCVPFFILFYLPDLKIFKYSLENILILWTWTASGKTSFKEIPHWCLGWFGQGSPPPPTPPPPPTTSPMTVPHPSPLSSHPTLSLSQPCQQSCVALFNRRQYQWPFSGWAVSENSLLKPERRKEWGRVDLRLVCAGQSLVYFGGAAQGRIPILGLITGETVLGFDEQLSDEARWDDWGQIRELLNRNICKRCHVMQSYEQILGNSLPLRMNSLSVYFPQVSSIRKNSTL